MDVECKEDDLILGTPHFAELKKLFDKYEFPSLKRQIPQLEEIFITDKSITLTEATASEEKSGNTLSFSVATPDKVIEEAIIKGIVGVSVREDKISISSSNLVANLRPDQKILLRDILQNRDVTICGFDIKSLLNTMSAYGIKPLGKLWDVELMHYLLMPERSHKIEILSQSYLGINLESEKELVQADLFSSQNIAAEEESGEKLNAEASVMIPLAQKLREELERGGTLKLYEDIEMPLIYVLASMEQEGINLDTEMLKEYGMALSKELDDIEKRVREMAEDSSLNVSSPKQLSVILYDKMDLGLGKKGGGRSTDEETLMEIIDKHPIIPAILEYRNLKKLISTYIEPLPALVSGSSGKLHTTYNQALTATGRLSSVKPNLQNIPIRTERGREIRRAFIPSRPDGVILSADYSQIELRLMAHMSGDPDFIDAFRQGRDIHSATASKIFGIPEEELTKEQRGRAKTANFGIIYGISSFGLSQRLNIPRAESKKLIEDYFRSYPKVKEYMTGMTEMAKKDGYVTTLYGRRRYLPDINSRNQVVRGLAERNAVNAPIQGSAADIIKVAMIRLWKRLQNENLKSKMVLQVHDELVFDVFPGEEEILSVIVKEEMERVIELSVPLTVECQYGRNWLEAH